MGVEKAREACPGEITVEAGAPDHRADTTRGQVESTDRRFGKAFLDEYILRPGLEELAAEADVSSMNASARPMLRQADIVTEVVAEMHLVAIDIGDAAEQGGALPAE